MLRNIYLNLSKSQRIIGAVILAVVIAVVVALIWWGGDSPEPQTDTGTAPASSTAPIDNPSDTTAGSPSDASSAVPDDRKESADSSDSTSSGVSSADTWVQPKLETDDSSTNYAVASLTNAQAQAAKAVILAYGTWKTGGDEATNSAVAELVSQGADSPANTYWTTVASKKGIAGSNLKALSNVDFTTANPSISSETDTTATVTMTATTNLISDSGARLLTGAWTVTLDKQSGHAISFTPPAY